jgi:hypothetical protein
VEQICQKPTKYPLVRQFNADQRIVSDAPMIGVGYCLRRFAGFQA